MMIATHIYLFESTPKKIMDVGIGSLHALAGLGLGFFILYKAYYGALLQGPCWLFYKVLEGAFTAFRKITSLHVSAKCVAESAWHILFIPRSEETERRYDPHLARLN